MKIGDCNPTTRWECKRCRTSGWGPKGIEERFEVGGDGEIGEYCKICGKFLLHTKRFLLRDSKLLGVKDYPLPLHIGMDGWKKSIQEKDKGGFVYLTDGVRIWGFMSGWHMGIGEWKRLYGEFEWLDCEENERIPLVEVPKI